MGTPASLMLLVIAEVPIGFVVSQEIIVLQLLLPEEIIQGEGPITLQVPDITRAVLVAPHDAVVPPSELAQLQVQGPDPETAEAVPL